MRRLPYVKITLAILLLAATCLALTRVRTFNAAKPIPGLTSQSKNVVGTLVQSINVDGMIPLAVKEFENVITALKVDLVDSPRERPDRLHPYAGTVFDDPSCQLFQEFEPWATRHSWLATAPDFSIPQVGGFLLAF